MHGHHRNERKHPPCHLARNQPFDRRPALPPTPLGAGRASLNLHALADQANHKRALTGTVPESVWPRPAVIRPDSLISPQHTPTSAA